MKINEEKIKILEQCPLCQEKYKKANFFVVEEGAQGKTVHITCPVCHHALLARVTVTNSGIYSLALVTDLDKEDAIRVAHRESISQKDVLAFHKLIRNNSEYFMYSLTK
ncbi:MAG: hypothetical protein V1848_03710 [Candidatus Magasanikbacteria bacterium]